MDRRAFFTALTGAFAWCTRWSKEAGICTATLPGVPSGDQASCPVRKARPVDMATIKFNNGSREVTLPCYIGDYFDVVRIHGQDVERAVLDAMHLDVGAVPATRAEWSLPLPTYQPGKIRFAIKLSPVYDTDKSAVSGWDIDQSDSEMEVYHQLNSDKWIYSPEEIILLVHAHDGSRLITKKYHLTNCLIAYGYLWFAGFKADAPYRYVA